MSKVPSPCIDVCKYKLKGSRCIGCGMTREQKKEFKELDGKNAKRLFVAMLRDEQARLPLSFAGWEKAYRRKCEKKGARCPLDALPVAE